MTDAWDRLAPSREQRTGETGDLWHRALIDPSVRRLIGSVQGLRVLELACGNGYLARLLAGQGAREVVGIDRSAVFVRLARARERRASRGVRFERADATRLPFAAGSFDLVVANMALMDIRNARGAVREAARVLGPRGRLVFSIGHPCFDLDDRSTWQIERGFDAKGVYRDTVYRKVRGYREERATRVPWHVGPGAVLWTPSYHRTLSTYSRYLADAGFAIARLEEPSPLPPMLLGSPQGRYIAEIPLHLVVEAVRLDDRPTVASRTTVRTRRVGGRRSGSGGRTARSGSVRRGSTSAA